MLVTLALTGCGRIDFGAVALAQTDAAPPDGSAPDGSGLQPLHQYSLNGTYNDDFGGPPLTGHGGVFVAGGYQFAVNQGLSVIGALPQSVYTVDIVFSFADLASWKKILDYEGLTLDSGFYTFDGALQYVIVPGSDFITTQVSFVVNAMARVTLTRDATNQVVAYRDGAPVPALRATGPTPPAVSPPTPFEFADPGRVAALTGNTATFFIDDTATGSGEASAGLVRRIRIYDVALTAAQVAASP